MTLKKLSIMLTAAAVLSAPMAFAAGDAAAGKAKSALCVSCHGAEGKAPIMPTYPKIGGQNAGYIVDALKAYKAGQRTSAQAGMMAGMAAPLSDADIDNLAAYFSSL